MDQLPIELHIKILNLLLTLSWQHDPLSARDLRSPSLFPFNAASVCIQWLDTLSQIPECWTRVVFDVARDPTPFLDAFLWSKDLQRIEVVVFTSSGYEGATDERSERRRTFAIVQALRPHIDRCRSINFDVTYSTSLPPANIFFIKDAPDLEELALECLIDNIEISQESWATTVTTQLRFATSFPSLKKLSLTGFLFIYLGLHLSSAEWFTHLNIARPAELYLTQFAFLESGHYTLPNFVHYLSAILRKGSRSIYFRDLSLSYRYEDSTPLTKKPEFILIARDIHFQSVSKSFIARFFATSKMICIRSLTFKGCAIPKIWQERFVHSVNYLTLDHVTDNENGDGLRCILDAWTPRPGSKLEICACPSFNDTLFAWLRPSEYSETYPVKCLSYIYIRDCPTFTPSVLREVVKARNARPIIDSLSESRLFELSVTGKGPRLTKEDKDWFSESITTVKWITENDEGVWEEFNAPDTYHAGPV